MAIITSMARSLTDLMVSKMRKASDLSKVEAESLSDSVDQWELLTQELDRAADGRQAALEKLLRMFGMKTSNLSSPNLVVRRARVIKEVLRATKTLPGNKKRLSSSN